MNKLKHNASASIRGTIYQFYVALEKCFGLLEGKSIYIEKYGDVTSSTEQIEVKHYQRGLTNLDLNLWKTLKNWLDDDFNIGQYSGLILLTTQKIGANPFFADWNNKTAIEKRQILDTILADFYNQARQSSNTKTTLEYVLNENRIEKLLEILEKFKIDDSAPRDVEYVNNLKQRYCKHVPQDNRDNYINTLMGYLVSPGVSNNKDGWEITYTDFSQKSQTLTEVYGQNATIFPHSSNPSEEESNHCSSYQFVTKIKDINYNEVISKATSDFIRTRNIISKELKQYQFNKTDYENYENDIHTRYATNYITSSRNTNTQDTIKDSKNFYDEITGQYSPKFRNFNDTPIYFKNGLLHEMANDEKNIDKVVWRLKVEVEDE